MKKDKKSNNMRNHPTKKELNDALDDIHGRKDGIVKKVVTFDKYPNVRILNKGYGFEESITEMFQGIKDDIEKEKK